MFKGFLGPNRFALVVWVDYPRIDPERKLFDVLFSVNSEVLVFSNYYRFNLLATILMSMLIVALNYWLIPIYGIEGAALASAMVMLLFNLVKYSFLKIKLNFNPFSIETLRILAVGIATYAPFYFFQLEQNPIINILITSIGILMLYVFWSKILGAGKEELNWIKERLKSKKSGS